MLDNVVIYFSDLLTTPTFVLISSLFGLFGTLFGFWSHFYSNKRKIFSYESSTYEIIRNSHTFLDNIEITHRRKD